MLIIQTDIEILTHIVEIIYVTTGHANDKLLRRVKKFSSLVNLYCLM